MRIEEQQVAREKPTAKIKYFAQQQEKEKARPMKMTVEKDGRWREPQQGRRLSMFAARQNVRR